MPESQTNSIEPSPNTLGQSTNFSSHFSHVWLCVTPQTAAHQAPPSRRFSRQEHWSGLPFPSLMHESEKWKWKWSCVLLLATPWTAAYQAPPSMGFSRQEYWSGVPLPSPRVPIATCKPQVKCLQQGQKYHPVPCDVITDGTCLVKNVPKKDIVFL